MAKDDMEVIQYKILEYLYGSIKAGHQTSLEEMAWKCKLFEITREYWLVILRELIEEGYVSGLKYIDSKDMESVIEIGQITITKAGRQYLREAFKIMLGSVIGML